MAEDQFQYIKLPDGSYGKFLASATDDTIRSAIQGDFPTAFKAASPLDNPSAYATQQAHSSGTKPLQKASQRQLSGMAPQERYLASVPPEQRQAATDRMAAGTSMAVPEFLMSMGALGPVGAIQRKGLIGGAKAIGLPFLRATIGASTGAKAGEYVGAPIGKAFGNEQAGGQVGSTVGALVGAATLSNPGAVSKVPFLGRMMTSDQEYANALAARKLARIQANRNVGLAPSENEIVSKLPPWMKPSPEEEAQATRPFRPREPLIGTPQDWQNYDQSLAAHNRQMSSIKEEAKDSGMYSAARGKTQKKLNYQQRIQKRLGP